jgi:uncharacterized protein YbjT (DUF2867 family)
LRDRDGISFDFFEANPSSGFALTAAAARCEEAVNEAGKAWAGERANAMLDRAEKLHK